MKQTLVLLSILTLAACGAAPDDDVEFPTEDTGVEAPDDELGEDMDSEDPAPGVDACVDLDDCVGPALLPVELDDVPSQATAVEPETVAAPAYPVGSKMITTVYAGFHRLASSSSSLLDVAPHDGVHHDSLHPTRHPLGVLPPAQTVTVVDSDPSHGFLHVRFQNVNGWISVHKLVRVNANLEPAEFALQSSVRNAFFKHQIRRSLWNKDGPLHSGNCAPTSLAMAAHVFGAEPSGLSVEESIHRIRSKYDAGLHESRGTTRAQIETAARAINLHVHPLRTDVSPSAALTRLRGQLNLGRVVVLTGIPGKANAGPTLYERAFNRAYANARSHGMTLQHSTYDFNGGHSILVMGVDGAGRYVVGDPISEVGFVAITAAEMKDYMTRYTGARGTGNAVWK